jgi:predicted kinase
MLGAPGSGKTRLGTLLARELRIPFLARDDVRGGLYFTAGAWGEHPGPVPSRDEAVEVFLGLVEALAGAGVSCVAEYVVRDDRPQDLARITSVADCVGVRTSCDDAAGRRTRRERADRLFRRRPVLESLGYRTVDEHAAAAAERMAVVATQMRTAFDFPVVDVDTSDGYDPTLDEIVEAVVSQPPPN